MNHSYSTYDDVVEKVFDETLASTKTAQSSLYENTIANNTQLKNNVTNLVCEQSITTQLNQFMAHGLTDLNNAKLMNRVDSKFLLPIALLPELLDELKTVYTVLEINNKRISTYENQYLDTPNMAFYRDHHNGKLNRYKIRRRKYVDTDTEFLEVKLKNNQRRTIKNRIKISGQRRQDDKSSQFIRQHLNGRLPFLDVSQHSGYQRIALANEEQAERLTLDFNLWFKNDHDDNVVRQSGFFIAELKQVKKSKRSPFYQLMSAKNHFPSAFSKYCIGCALLYNRHLKTNRFKPILSRLKQFK